MEQKKLTTSATNCRQKFYSNNYEEKQQAFLNSGHIWQEDESGFIDIFAIDSGRHNGPVCTKCGYSICWHCNPVPTKCRQQ